MKITKSARLTQEQADRLAKLADWRGTTETAIIVIALDALWERFGYAADSWAEIRAQQAQGQQANPT